MIYTTKIFFIQLPKVSFNVINFYPNLLVIEIEKVKLKDEYWILGSAQEIAQPLKRHHQRANIQSISGN